MLRCGRLWSASLCCTFSPIPFTCVYFGVFLKKELTRWKRPCSRFTLAHSIYWRSCLCCLLPSPIDCVMCDVYTNMLLLFLFVNKYSSNSSIFQLRRLCQCTVLYVVDHPSLWMCLSVFSLVAFISFHVRTACKVNGSNKIKERMREWEREREREKQS